MPVGTAFITSAAYRGTKDGRDNALLQNTLDMLKLGTVFITSTSVSHPTPAHSRDEYGPSLLYIRIIL